jgi:hypothetical protein
MKDIELTAQVLFLCVGSFQLQVIQHPHYQLSPKQSIKDNYNLEMLFSVQEPMLSFLQDGPLVILIIQVCKNQILQQELLRELYPIHFGTMYHAITQFVITMFVDHL